MTMDAANRFRTLWEETWRGTPGLDASVLMASYRHPSRAYHNLAHIVQCLDVLSAYERGASTTVPMEVRVAVFYHDVIYDPTRKDNEEASARFAREALSPWMP